MKAAAKILIVGTGIGGGAAACALAKAGANVHAIEIKPEIPTTGTGICLLANTMRAIAALGLEEQCLDHGARIKTFREMDLAGRSLSSSPMPQGCGMKRPDLARVLEGGATKAGAFLEKGVSVESLHETLEGVEVTFTNGKQAVYDLVVAADGAYSKLRDQFFGVEYAAKFVGQSCWRFSAARTEEVDGLAIYRSQKGAVGAIPTGPDSCYLFVLENSKEPIRMSAEESLQVLRQRLSEYTAPTVRAAIDAIQSPDQVLFRPFDGTFVPGPWNRGRIVLMGDAAHAPTPQLTSGGGMAIEDAVVMGESVANHKSIEEVLAAYNARRVPRAKRVWDNTVQLCKYEQNPTAENNEKSNALLLESYKLLAEPY